MATTEEMNIKIAKYMCLDYKDGHLYFGDIVVSNYLFDYHKDWNKLLEVLRKVRPHVHGCKANEDFYWDCINNMHNAIVSIDITKLHRLIYEAIIWLNQNKPK